MIKQKGKIISMPIDKVDGGIITYYNDGKVLEGDPSKTHPNLKTLMVEYNDCNGCMKLALNGSNSICCGDKKIRVPLQQSQWQEALDKGYIDNNIQTIDFILEIPFYAKSFVAKVIFTKTWADIIAEANEKRSQVRPVTAHMERERIFWDHIITNYNVPTPKQK